MRFGIIAVLAVMLCAAALAQGAETSKVVVVNMRITGSGMELLSSSIEYGLPPDCIGSGVYTYSARASGVVIAECGLSDPRVSTGDTVAQNGTVEGIVVVQPEADFTLVFPFNPAMLTLEVMNATTNESVFHAGLSELAQGFCASHPQDPDCAPSATPTPEATQTPTAAAQDNTLLYAIGAGIIVLLLVIVALLVVFLLKKK